MPYMLSMRFVAVGDDSVDEAATKDEARANLTDWWQHIDNVYQGHVDSSKALELGLAWVLERYDVPKRSLL